MFFSHRYEDISTRHHNYSIIRLIIKQMFCFSGVNCPMNVHIECLKNTEARTHELIALIFVISLEREFSLFPRTSLVRDWVSRVVNYSSFPTLHRRLAKNACYWIKRELSSTKDRNDFFSSVDITSKEESWSLFTQTHTRNEKLNVMVLY